MLSRKRRPGKQPLIHDIAPALLPPNVRPDREIPLDPQGGDTCWWGQLEASPEKIRNLTATTRAGYFATLQDYRILEGPERALHDLLDLCHVVLRGADAFTRPLGTEVLGPLVAGRLHRPASLAEGK